MSGLTGSPLLRPTELLASLTETFTSALSTVRSPSPLADITTVATGRFHRRVFHPLDLQLASLHWFLTFPMRTRAEHCPRPDAGSPSFRCIPFARDVFFDPGRVATPRFSGIAHVAFDVLYSLCPCGILISWLNRHPMQSLCTLRGRRCRRLTQHSLPGALLGLPGPIFHRLDYTSFGWRLPSN